MQAHGHTSDRNTDLSFEQDADDIAALLNFLTIPKADFLGFSNGAQTAIEIFLRHPQMVNKLIFASAFFKREAAPPGFWKGFETATLNDMPAVLKDAFLAIHDNQEMLQNMFDKDVKRMKNFKGWTSEQISTINVPSLIINSVYDVGSLEHAVEWHRLLPGSEIAVFPGGHGSYLGAIESLKNDELPRFNALELIEEFLEK
jgi:pimeloyl-ACP methyl ester carboxylesterase